MTTPVAAPDPGPGGADLHLELPAEGARRTALAQALRSAVRSGRLAGGTLLPPYRTLAADLGLARNAVADAYAELVAEGWFTARQGSGTRVAEGVATPDAPSATVGPAPDRPRYDLMQGKPDPASFPRAAWATSARRALAEAPTEAFGPGDPQGRPELRRALAGYLSRARGVRCGPENIVICSGFANGLRLLASVRPPTGPSRRTGCPSTTASSGPPGSTRTPSRSTRTAPGRRNSPPGSPHCCSHRRTSSRRAAACCPHGGPPPWNGPGAPTP